MKRIWQIAVGILRELSDESAYRRHLAAHGLIHSRREWQRFYDHRLRTKYLRARCC